MEDENCIEAPTHLTKVVMIQGSESAEKEINDLLADDWEFMHGAGNAMVFEKFEGVLRRRRGRRHNLSHTEALLEPESERDREFNMMSRSLRDAHLTLDERSKQIDPDSVKHWDAMRAERDQARIERDEFRIIMHELAEALMWASGADEFQAGQRCAPGWDKGPRIALEHYRDFMRKLERDFLRIP